MHLLSHVSYGINAIPYDTNYSYTFSYELFNTVTKFTKNISQIWITTTTELARLTKCILTLLLAIENSDLKAHNDATFVYQRWWHQQHCSTHDNRFLFLLNFGYFTTYL